MKLRAIAVWCALVFLPQTLLAQGGGGGGGGGGNGNVIIAGQTAGVQVDAQGVLRLVVRDAGGRLLRQRILAAQAQLDPEVAQPSPLRKISLNRLEQVIAEHLAAGKPLQAEVKYLAGLTRVQFVFFYPETGDIVLAGPAEGWVEDAVGRVRGIHSGRPTILLEDLLAALRAFPPGQVRQNFVVGCSIDPTQEGLARLQRFLRQVGRYVRPGSGPAIAQGIRKALGYHNIRVLGISPRTHMAHVLVEADYRMKLIGIGLERPPVKIRSYVDLATRGGSSRNALQRWYFVPDYECVRVSEDGLAMELVGQGVKLVNESEVVLPDGRRLSNVRPDRASVAFVRQFTARFPQLAAAEPVFAQLRTAIDLLIAAAFIQQQDYYGKANWPAELLRDEQRLPIEVLPAPQRVETAVNVLWRRGRLYTPLGGGVQIQPYLALASERLLRDEKGQVAQLRVKLSQLPPGRWWWD